MVKNSMDKAFTVEKIHIEAMALQGIVTSFASLKCAFNQASKSDFSSPEVRAVIDNSVALKAKNTAERLLQLSQERAEAIFDEVKGSLDIASTAMDRVRILLRDRKPIYRDDQIEACREDIFDHLGYDDQSFDKYAGHLSSEQRTGQVGLHLTRAAGFVSAIESFDQENKHERIEALNRKLVRIKDDHIRVSQGVAHVTEHGPISEEKLKELYAYAPPLPADVRKGFGKTSFDLGKHHVSISKAALARLQNIISYMYLIDQELKPQNHGDSQDWDQNKQSFKIEAENTFAQVTGFMDRTQKYLMQSLYFAPDASI